MKALYTTQGGGVCEYIGNIAVWVEVPRQFSYMRVGDPIPQDWGTVAINSSEESENIELEEY